MAKSTPAKPVVMVSSTVYGSEELLDNVYRSLTKMGYPVWMSWKGTLPVDPQKSNFANCLEAVEKCDLFLGVISRYYGSGKVEGDLSITHQELLRAIELDKLRWFVAHEHVLVARQLLKQFRFRKDGRPRKGFVFQKTPVLDDIRLVDMYEAAIRQDEPAAERIGNWVQPYSCVADAIEYFEAQLSDQMRIHELLTSR